jgi:hypothetical protein
LGLSARVDLDQVCDDAANEIEELQQEKRWKGLRGL